MLIKVDAKTVENRFHSLVEKKKEKEDLRIKELEAKKQKEEDAKTAHLENVESLKKWALVNATELVKLRIEEDMNWYELALDEYFASILPTGFETFPLCNS